MNPERSIEYQRAESQWTTHDLRQYLLALSYNGATKDYCLPQLQYPRAISLSPAWHETLEDLRAQTAATYHEYWVLIGASETRDRIVLSTQFVQGGGHQISGKVKAQKIAKARGEGIPFIVGDIHTHPSTPFSRFTGFENYASLEDLYCLLLSPTAPAVQVVVGPTRNTIAFRSHESEIVSRVDQKNFVRFWRRRLISREMIADTRSVRQILAKRYALAFYEGEPGEALSRIFP